LAKQIITLYHAAQKPITKDQHALVKVEELGKKIPKWKVVVIANNNGMVKDK
jgi:hypothetical protein